MMSGNQKQGAGGGPQTQRYAASPYQQFPGADGYVSTPPGPYVPNQGNQGGNHGPGGLRAIPSAVPPNQAPTPPNADIKVQAIPQQPAMNPSMYVPNVRTQQYFPQRTTAPTSQTPRMPANHNNRQAMYPTAPFLVHQQPGMFLPPYYQSNRAPPMIQSTLPALYMSQPPYSYSSQPQTQATVPYFNMIVSRTGTMPPQQSTVSNPNPSTMSIPMVPNNPPHQPFQKQPPNKRRPNAIAVIDPATGEDKLLECFEDTSHPPSGESSARQTPQPAAYNHNKEVQATFAKQVHDAIYTDHQELSRGADDAHPDHHHHQPHHQTHHQPHHGGQQQHQQHQDPMIDHQGVKQNYTNTQQQQQQPPPQMAVQQQQQPNVDHIVQSSSFNAMAKEFVLPTATATTAATPTTNNTAKETPIVSANCDAVEVTLPLPKDRESPVKGRKQREQQQQQQQQQLPKETILKEKEVVVKELQPQQQQQQVVVNLLEKKQPQQQQPQQPPKKIDVKVVEPQKVSSAEYEGVGMMTLNQQPGTPVQDINSNAKTKSTQRLAAKQNVVVSSAPSAVASQQQHQQQQQQPPQQPPQNNATPAAKPPLHVAAAATPVVAATPPPPTPVIAAPTPAVAPVPQPQPPKPSNKTHKRNELNLKGANKEGTDMDAFNDNNMTMEVNANNQSNISDIINANANNNAVPPLDATITPTAPPPAQPVSNDSVSNKKQQDSNDATIKITEPVKTIKSKVDVTAIVKDVPKTIIKAFNNETHDETDRAVPTNQLVQAKNEVNAKVNSEIKSSSSSSDLKLPYQDGQWTPTNQTGAKIYQKDFLLSLRNVPNSKVKPDNIPDMILADGRGQLSDGRASMGGGGGGGGGRTDFTNPPFTSYGGGKSGSLRGSLSKNRPSLNKMVQGVKAKSTKLSISVKEDVKLHEVENAWRPARLVKGVNASEDDKKTEELYKKVRGVLNKLTPQKFDTLLSQIKALKIDTTSRLQGVIDLVFDKAVDEPNFSVAYALMCKELALMQVPNDVPDDKSEFVNFRKLLVTRCQNEFEKQSQDESIRNNKVLEIEQTTDPEKKKDLQFELEEYDRKLRMKSVGNIRFIGELFKQNMLTVNIVVRCLTNLLQSRDEESLECLCKLLTTIGKELEMKGVNLQDIFNQMKILADKKDAHRVSSRIRFMLQDVIDLRNSKWVSRRQDLNPKTIDQIIKEADHEQMNIQIMNSVPMTPRKDDRMGPGSNMDRKGGRGGRNIDSDGWVTKNNRTFTFNSDKLKTKAPTMDEPLGSSAMFGSWGKGSVGSNTNKPYSQQQQQQQQQQPIAPNTSNIYSALENIDSEKRSIGGGGGGGRSKEPYSSKGPSLELNSYNKYDSRSGGGGGGSRSGSLHRSNDSSGNSSQRSTPAPQPQQPQKPPLIQHPPQQQQQQPQQVAQTQPQKESEPSVKLTEDQILFRLENDLEEYVSGVCTAEECYQDLREYMHESSNSEIIARIFPWLMEKSQNIRFKVGEMFAKLIQLGRINVDEFCVGFQEILSQADDLKIDIPKFWDYLAEILVDAICKEALPLARLPKCFADLLTPKDTVSILVPLFKLIIVKEGAEFLQSLWSKSGVKLSEFALGPLVDSFIKDNKFEFLISDAAPVAYSNLSLEEVHAKLKEFFKEKAKPDEIIKWIEMHLGKRVQDLKFIRTLATAIFEDCMVNKKAQADKLTHHNNLLLKYVDNNPKFELECLYALQALIHKLEHPQGALLMIVEKLYELGVSSHESFITWEESTDPAEQEGKGVALKQLVSFFTQLKENDDDEEENDEEDDNENESEDET